MGSPRASPELMYIVDDHFAKKRKACEYSNQSELELLTLTIIICDLQIFMNSAAILMTSVDAQMHDYISIGYRVSMFP